MTDTKAGQELWNVIKGKYSVVRLLLNMQSKGRPDTSAPHVGRVHSTFHFFVLCNCVLLIYWLAHVYNISFDKYKMFILYSHGKDVFISNIVNDQHYVLTHVFVFLFLNFLIFIFKNDIIYAASYV